MSDESQVIAERAGELDDLLQEAALAMSPEAYELFHQFAERLTMIFFRTLKDLTE